VHGQRWVFFGCGAVKVNMGMVVAENGASLVRACTLVFFEMIEGWREIIEDRPGNF
jgi:hypothetical protein